MTTPTINSVAPLFGSNDAVTSIRIYGTSFSSPTVYVGDTPCVNVSVPNSTQINCDVPAGIIPSSYDIRVENDGDPNTSDTLEDAFRVIYPMPAPRFETETKEVILARLLSQMEEDWEVAEGSPIHAIMATAALELARAYRRADDIVRLFFPQYSRAGYLDLYGEAIGIVRNASIRATGQVTFTGTNGTVIPVGTRVSTQTVYGQQSPPITFETTAQGVISDGTATVAIRALTPGESGNLSGGQIVRMASPVAGVTSVNNANPTTGGEEIESDDAYRVRILNFVQNPVAGGNARDYITWALEVPGVGDASVVPLGRGNGTVDVYILDDDFEPAGSGLVDAVQEYIAPEPTDEGGGKAPIGADVLVAAPTTVNIDVTVEVTARPGYVEEDVFGWVEDSIRQFIKNLSIGEDVLYTHVANAIHDTEGVFTYTNLTVNSGTSDVSVTVSQKAKANTVTVS